MKSDILLLFISVIIILLLFVLFTLSVKSEGFIDGPIYSVSGDEFSSSQADVANSAIADAKSGGTKYEKGWASTMSNFTKAQHNYFGDEINRSLPTNNGLRDSISKFSSTVFNVDTMLNRNVLPDKLPFNFGNSPDGISTNSNVAKILSPGQLPIRTNNAQQGAFSQPINKDCMSIKKPINLDKRDPREVMQCGWWYFDDNNKQSICTMGTKDGPIDPEFAKNNPGGIWMWTPVEAQKKEDAKICRNIKSCSTADLQPDCGFCLDTNLGIPTKASKVKYPDDANLRCNTVITDPSMCPPPSTIKVPKIVFADNGATLRSGDIYKGEEIPFDIVKNEDICEPNSSNGKLSKDCLLSLLSAIGYTSESIFVKIINGDTEGYYTRAGPNYEMYQITRRILIDKEKFEVRGPLVGDGALSKAELISDYRRVYNLAKNTDSLTKKAAEWFVFGKTYDPCDYDRNDTGPFELFCLKNVALEAGCQADGYKFPTATSSNEYNNMKWSNYVKYFSDLFSSMSNKSDPIKQRQATLDCLGITIASDAAILCGDPTKPCKVLTEAEIQSNQAVLKAQDQIDYYILQLKKAKTPIEKELADMLLNEAYAQKTKTIAMIRKINFCPPNPPFACWDFSLGRYDDRLEYYNSVRSGSILYSYVAEKKAALFKGNEVCVKVSGNISTAQIKSISMMIYLNSLSPLTCLWTMTNTPLGDSWCKDSISGCVGNDLNKGAFMIAKKNCQGPTIMTNTDGVSLELKKWFHIVWAIDKDYTGMTIYINGVKSGRWSDPNDKQTLRDRFFRDFYIGRNENNADKDIAIRWTRLFDYTMDERSCKSDMADVWTFPALPPVPPEPESSYDYQGCFNDKNDRALPLFAGRVGSADECYGRAKKEKDVTAFGLQFGGECWLGKNAKYARHGEKDEDTCGSLGPAYGNRVFTINQPKCDITFSGPIVENKAIANIKHDGDYNLSFTINVSGVIGNWGNIVRFTNSTRDCCAFGDRGPAIWFWPSTTKLYIVIGDSLTGGDWSLIETNFVVPLNKDCKFELSCVGQDVMCRLDNEVYKTTQPGSRPTGSFLVYASDPIYPSAKATLSNLCFQILPKIVAPMPPKFIGPAVCKNLGKPSKDRRTRVYTKEECDTLGGTWNPDGECKNKGGSFSWTCRVLNN